MKGYKEENSHRYTRAIMHSVGNYFVDAATTSLNVELGTVNNAYKKVV